MTENADKYYVPSIEEFHKGFEYELVPSLGTSIFNFEGPEEKAKTIWATEFKKGLFLEQDVDLSSLIAAIVAGIKEGKCRVKLLGQEDIESLGFSFVMNVTARSLRFRKEGLVIVWDRETERTKIAEKPKGLAPSERGMHEYSYYTRFDGVLKNKSELKRILEILERNHEGAKDSQEP